MLQFTLLGSFEARVHNTALPFATDKIRGLLAYLALESGVSHRRDTLAALLWPDYPNEIALRNLRQSLYRLRQTLAKVAPALPDHLLTLTRKTVALHREHIHLDAAEFARLRAAASSAADPLPALTEAAALYRGELLAGFSLPDAYAFDEWLTLQREHYHQRACQTLQKLATLHEDRHNYPALFQTVHRLIALDPWQETAHRQIMLAYAQTGQKNQAISHFKQYQTKLQAELGFEPVPETRAYYRQLTGSASALAGPRASSPPAHRLHHFPGYLASLIGRGKELDQITATLQNPASRLITLTGPGGAGKTRLSVAAARRVARAQRRFSDGLYFVPLAPLTKPELLIPTLAQNLGVELSPRGNPQTHLENALQNKSILLILDNFEHLLPYPQTTAFVHALLTNVPTLTIFVTSREPLNLQGEWHILLEGLPHQKDASDASEAAAFFIQTARRYRPSFTPEVETEHIHTICRLTGGLPLALEMAAVRLRAYSCATIAEQIAASLDFLTSPLRNTPARQRSMRAVLSSSWNLLPVRQQTALAALSVFQGGFTLEAALRVSEATILDLAALVDKTFLRRGGEDHREVRYDMHALVRQFAEEKLSVLKEASLYRERHAIFYFSMLEEHAPTLNGPTPREGLTILRRDLENIRLAWRWATKACRLNLLHQGLEGLSDFYRISGANQEAEAVYDHTLNILQKMEHPERPGIEIISFIAVLHAWALIGQGKVHEATQAVNSAIEIAEAYQHDFYRAHALSLQGWILQTQGEYDAAEQLLRTACDIFQTLKGEKHLSLALIRLGSLYWRRADYAQALIFYKQSLEIEQHLNNKQGIGRAMGGIGLANLFLGHFTVAQDWLLQALQIDRELGNTNGIGRQLGNLGTLHQSLGDFSRALAYYKEAAEVARASNNKLNLAIWWGNIGEILRRTGDAEAALSYSNQAIVLNKEVGDRFNLAENLNVKAETLMSLGRFTEAEACLQESLENSQIVDRERTRIYAHILRARLAAKTRSETIGIEQLLALRDKLLEHAATEEYLAETYYALWEISGEHPYGLEARTYYETLYRHMPKAIFQKRIQDLSVQ